MQPLLVASVSRTNGRRDDNIRFDAKADPRLNNRDIGDALSVALRVLLLHFKYVVFLIRPYFLVPWRGSVGMVTQN